MSVIVQKYGRSSVADVQRGGSSCVSAGPLRISTTIDESQLASAQRAPHGAFVDGA
jgi:hypothetical protein